MNEFFQASISLVNLPFTVLLVLIILYWLTVIFGAVDIELFDFDIDLDSDVDMDMDVDAPGGFFHSILSLLNVGEVPFIVVMSVMILCGWCISMLSNHYLNVDQSLLISAGLLVPNLIVSLIVAGLVTRPLRRVFSTLSDDEKHQKVLRKVGVIITSEVNATFGQMEIETKGAPVVINVRTLGETILKKGDKALVCKQDKEKGIYFIEKYNT